MYLRELTPVIQSSISPVLMISAVALILLSMTNRYGRVIDSARRVMQQAQRAEPVDREIALAHVHLLYNRCRSLRVSIFLSALSILMMACLVGTLFVASFLQLELSAVLASFFVASVFFLTASIITFMADINVSLHVLGREVADLTNKPDAASPLHFHCPEENLTQPDLP